MLISVDLPAPFSPMIPVIDPRATASDTPLLACTGPNDLSIDRSSMAGAVTSRGETSIRMGTTARSIDAGVVAHVIVHLDLAGNDIGLGLIDLRLHLRADQLLIVLVERPVDAAFLQAEHRHAGLPGAGH